MSGSEFKRRRKALGWSVDTLARKTGLSRRTINNVESGKAGEDSVREVDRVLALGEEGLETPEQEHVLRVEFRPGVWLTLDADAHARLGDLREAEDRIQALIRRNGA